MYSGDSSQKCTDNNSVANDLCIFSKSIRYLDVIPFELVKETSMTIIHADNKHEKMVSIAKIKGTSSYNE